MEGDPHARVIALLVEFGGILGRLGQKPMVPVDMGGDHLIGRDLGPAQQGAERLSLEERRQSSGMILRNGVKAPASSDGESARVRGGVV